jgi:outer membrane biosynthesis protein TonB
MIIGRVRALYCIVVVLTLGASAVILFAQTSSPAQGNAWTMESILRKSATRTVKPSYPRSAALKGNTGVAVARVYVALDGHVSYTLVLEAPSEDIAAAVVAAVGQWQFDPDVLTGGHPLALSGLLTFYFETARGKPVVLDPSEAKYVGRWRAK